jgi:hypothetical protein
LRQARPKSVAVARAFEKAASDGHTTSSVVGRMIGLSTLYSDTDPTHPSLRSPSSLTTPTTTTTRSGLTNTSDTKSNDIDGDDDENIGLDLSRIDPHHRK